MEFKHLASESESIVGYVLKCNKASIRVHIIGSNENLTLRISSRDAWYAVPGQCIEAIVTNRWTMHGVCFASGDVKRTWTDVKALGLEPLPLEDEGSRTWPL